MRYAFVVRGAVSEIVEAALPEMTVTAHPVGGTVLVADTGDADLLAQVQRLGDLGLLIVEARLLAA
jgi:AAA+ superfamily predicted ATPase